MIKIRLEGTEKEINDLVNNVTSHFSLGGKVFQVKQISKFYPNNACGNGGRVYIELE